MSTDPSTTTPAAERPRSATSRRVRSAAIVTALSTAVLLAAAGPAVADTDAPPIGPDATSVYLNGYPGLIGNSGFAVECVQRALLIEPDGDFGQETFDAVQAFQVMHGLDVDGVVGLLTGDRLAGAVPDQYRARCYEVIPTTVDLSTSEDTDIVSGPVVEEDDFNRCMDENSTGIPGLGKLLKIGKVYKKLKTGKNVDVAEIGRSVPGVDLVMMMSCVRYGPPS